MKYFRFNKMFALLSFILATLVISGCASTYQARRVEKSGFLDNYSILNKGKGDQALLIYINPQANDMCKQYTKVLLEPVTIWVKEKSSIEKVSEEDRQMLTDYLFDSLNEALSKDYEIVSHAGPDVLRVRVALTEADGSWVILDTITSIVPMALAASTLKQLVFGTASFVAEAAIEFEIEDSLTQQSLITGVDKRAGGKGWAKKFDKWGKVEKAFDYWAEKAQTRLTSCRAGTLEV